MSRRCKFCNRPILSDTSFKIYDYIHNEALGRKFKAITAREIAKHFNMSIINTNNYLLRLIELDLIRRGRQQYKYVYV